MISGGWLYIVLSALLMLEVLCCCLLWHAVELCHYFYSDSMCWVGFHLCQVPLSLNLDSPTHSFILCLCLHIAYLTFDCQFPMNFWLSTLHIFSAFLFDKICCHVINYNLNQIHVVFDCLGFLFTCLFNNVYFSC